MTSSINPNNIDGAYPVAGQDNDSQGFRDNFTNIRTNFSYAATELTDLQNKAVLKSALTGTTLDNDMGGSLLSNAQLQDISQTSVTLEPGSGSRIINYADGSYYAITLNGNIELSFTNFPQSSPTVSRLGVVRLQVTVTQNTDSSITLPSAVGYGDSTLNAANIIGLVGNVLRFPLDPNSRQTYVLEFWTTDSGTTIYINDVTRGTYSGSEEVADGDACSLLATTSYFNTSGASTATLAAGKSGQTKVLAMKSAGGDMVVTVADAGWLGSGAGTVTLSNTGDACTLQYVILDSVVVPPAGKWFCIGNNGAIFGS